MSKHDNDIVGGPLTWEDAGDQGFTMLLLDGASGIYLPQRFAYRFDNWQGVDAEDREILQRGPDEEYYNEAWDSVLEDAYWEDQDGDRWSLFQDGDLWAIRDDVEIDWSTV